MVLGVYEFRNFILNVCWLRVWGCMKFNRDLIDFMNCITFTIRLSRILHNKSLIVLFSDMDESCLCWKVKKRLIKLGIKQVRYQHVSRLYFTTDVYEN